MACCHEKSLWTGLVLGLLIAGCSGRPAAVSVPRIYPDEAGRLAISDYDTNNDGVLSRDELAQQAPGLLKSLSVYDTNGDKAISADEIAARLRYWQEEGTGLKVLECLVTLDGRPLPGATVVFDPEPFLGNAIKPATGATDGRGMATLAVAQEDLKSSERGLHAVYVGVYKVRITHPDYDIPPQYNTETTLGQETAYDSPGQINLTFPVKRSRKK